MAYKVFIDGQEGTTGLKIYERFKGRSDIELIRIQEEKRKDIEERLACMRKADITFLCLPDFASKEIVKSIDDRGEDIRLLDTSTAFRTSKEWVYGMAELCKEQRERISKAKRVSVPGCHATGFITLVRPLIELNLLKENYPICCTSVTGYSGGGKKMIAQYENNEKYGKIENVELRAPRQYGLAQNHKHIPEMKYYGKVEGDIIFIPIIGDFYSGMSVTVPLDSKHFRKEIRLEEVYKVYAKYYEDQPMIDVIEIEETLKDGFISANRLSGKDNLEILIYGNDEAIVLGSRFDNLGKGASGAAVQCMNLMLGLPESLGLI